MDLTGKAALITGAKRIGAVIAAALAARGAAVAISYARSQREAELAAERVRTSGGRAEIFRADLREPDACRDLVARSAAAFGRLDILINMASVYAERPFAELTAADWDAVIDVDLRGAFLCAHASVPHMRTAGAGRIVNFSDWVAKS